MSNTFKINKSFVDKTDFVSVDQKIYRDSALVGFALRVTKNSKVYIAERRKDGKLFRIVIGKHTEVTAAAARTKAEIMLAQIAKGEDPRKPRANRRDIPTLLQTYNEYIEEKNLKETSINSYRKQMYGYLIAYHKWRLDQFTRQDIVDIFKDISKGSKAQANSTMRMLSAIYNWAMFTYVDENEISLIKDNPVKIIKEKKLEHYVRPRTSHLDEDDLGPFVLALLSYEDESRWSGKAFSNNGRDLYFILLFTGMRLNEGQSLAWDKNIDLEKETLKVIDPKNGDDHLLPLGDFLTELLKTRAVLRRDEWVFPSRQNEGRHIENMRANLDNINKKAKTKITAHDMRRTYASVVHNLDYGLATIKRLLNHRDSTKQQDQTLRYIQLSNRRLKLAMNEIEDAYFEFVGISKAEAIDKIKASN